MRQTDTLTLDRLNLTAGSINENLKSFYDAFSDAFDQEKIWFRKIMHWWIIILVQFSALLAVDHNIQNTINHLSNKGKFHYLILDSNLINSFRSINVIGNSPIFHVVTNLEPLSIGTLKLPAVIWIGMNGYNVTKYISSTPNYEGSLLNDPSTKVVIRTNMIYGWFNKPKVFINQLLNTKKSGILMDYDIRHLILVNLDVKDLSSKYKYLGTGIIQFPCFQIIGTKIYVIIKGMVKNTNYILYSGYQRNNVNDHVHVKAFWDREKFQNELGALKNLGRLYDSNDKYMILASKAVEGYKLNYLLEHFYRNPEYVLGLIDKIQVSIKMLHLKFGIAHQNINAENIIVQSDGSLEFINFENARNYHMNYMLNHQLLQNDLDSAEKSLKAFDQVINAFRTPLALTSQRFFRKYVSDMVKLYGFESALHLWEVTKEQQCIDFIKKNGYSPKSSENLARRLNAASREDSEEPLCIFVGMNEYIITDYISSGAQGSTFRGYLSQDPNERVVFKIYKEPNARKAFFTEKRALIILGRLYDEDLSNLITVQEEIPGQVLSKWFINHDNISEEFAFKEAIQLLYNFQTEWNLVHNDVRPENIIRKPDGTLELIDFGYSDILSDNNLTYNQQINKDFQIAKREFRYYFLALEAKIAMENPLEPESESVVKEYVDMRSSRGDPFGARKYWSNFIFKLSRMKMHSA